jgi:hypothetical protein
VKSIVRSLFVCFLLLALPFQAFASASMLPRVVNASTSAHEAPAAGLPPCHQQIGNDHHAQAKPSSAHDSHDSHGIQHAKGKCGSCAACCVGAAMTPGLPAGLTLVPPRNASIPFLAGHLPSVDPALPERPPSTLLA